MTYKVCQNFGRRLITYICEPAFNQKGIRVHKPISRQKGAFKTELIPKNKLLNCKIKDLKYLSILEKKHINIKTSLNYKYLLPRVV